MGYEFMIFTPVGNDGSFFISLWKIFKENNMEKLNKLLQNGKEIWLEVEPKDFGKLLNFAKENEYKWINGNEIDLLNDLKNINHPTLLGLQNKQIGFVSAICWHCAKDEKKIKFSDLV